MDHHTLHLVLHAALLAADWLQAGGGGRLVPGGCAGQTGGGVVSCTGGTQHRRRENGPGAGPGVCPWLGKAKEFLTDVLAFMIM